MSLLPCAVDAVEQIARGHDVAATVAVAASVDAPAAREIGTKPHRPVVGFVARGGTHVTIAHAEVVALIERATGRVEIDVVRDAAADAARKLRHAEAAAAETRRAADLAARLTRDHVHDATHRRRAVDRRSRALQHLDAIDVVEQQRRQIRDARWTTVNQ